jgi:hypothetical protein
LQAIVEFAAQRPVSQTTVGLGKQLVGDQGAHQRVPLLSPIESTSASGNAVAALPVVRVIPGTVPRGRRSRPQVLAGTEGMGYLLKDRVGDIDSFVDSVAASGRAAPCWTPM